MSVIHTNEIASDCLACYAACVARASVYLTARSDILACSYARQLLACAELCRTTAHLAMFDTASFAQIADVCADVCERCSAAGDGIGDASSCADVCRRCAESCRLHGGHRAQMPVMGDGPPARQDT